jgi:hypothetical protein
MEQIIREYDETKRDAYYLNARKRMQYLHMKLTHIKNLILAYDQLYKKDTHDSVTSGSSVAAASVVGSLKRSKHAGSAAHTSGSGRHEHHHHNGHHQPSRSKMLLSSG